VGEVVFDGALDRSAGAAREEGAKPIDEPEPAVGVADEVEHGQAGLAGFAAQAAAELLEEEGRALGRTEEEDGVDAGNVDAFVEQILREHHVDRGGAEVPQRGVANGLGGLGIDGDRGDALAREERRHELRVGDRDAEPEGAHGARVVDLVVDRAEDGGGADVIGGVELLEALDVVATGGEVDAREVGAVVDAEVLERRDEALIEGVPQAQLGGDAAIEPAEDRLAVGALGVAVRPRSTLGVKWSSSSVYESAAAWWNSSTTRTS
jgi:hypothetical protein